MVAFIFVFRVALKEFITLLSRFEKHTCEQGLPKLFVMHQAHNRAQNWNKGDEIKEIKKQCSKGVTKWFKERDKSIEIKDICADIILQNIQNIPKPLKS
jgi:hypothetical protein